MTLSISTFRIKSHRYKTGGNSSPALADADAVLPPPKNQDCNFNMSVARRPQLTGKSFLTLPAGRVRSPRPALYSWWFVAAVAVTVGLRALQICLGAL